MKHYNRIKTCEPSICLNRTLPAPLRLPAGSSAAHHSVFLPEIPTIMNLSRSLAFFIVFLHTQVSSSNVLLSFAWFWTANIGITLNFLQFVFTHNCARKPLPWLSVVWLGYWWVTAHRISHVAAPPLYYHLPNCDPEVNKTRNHMSRQAGEKIAGWLSGAPRRGHC